MIQPTTLIPPSHFRLHIKNSPHSPTKQWSCVAGPQCANSKEENRAKEKKKVSTREQNGLKDTRTQDRPSFGIRAGPRWAPSPQEHTLPLPWRYCRCSFIGLPSNWNVPQILFALPFLERLLVRGKGAGATQPDAHVGHQYAIWFPSKACEISQTMAIVIWLQRLGQSWAYFHHVI